MHARITLRGGARNERVVEFLRVFVDGKVRLVVNVKIFVREIAWESFVLLFYWGRLEVSIVIPSNLSLFI